MVPADPSISDRPRVAVVGAAGYVGGELCRLLSRHPGVRLEAVVARGHAGARLDALHPHLSPAGLHVQEATPASLADTADVVMLALPHGQSAGWVAELGDSDLRVIDLSGDFRLRDPAVFAAAHRRPHPCPDALHQFVYGVPEHHREALASARRIASPGCFATALALAMLPLARAGWLDAPTHHVAATGSSGAGMAPGPGTHHPERAANLRAYEPLSHRHALEVDRLLDEAAQSMGHRAPAPVRFVPVAAPLSRGILATSFVELPEAVDGPMLEALLHRVYDDAPFVRVGTKPPEVVRVKGGMFADMHASVGTPDPATGRRPAVIVVALDNLLKGGAGQAVQSLNLMLGLRETIGLDLPAPFP